MIAPYANRTMTAEEFLHMDNRGWELVDGFAKEKNMGMFSASIAIWIMRLINIRFDWPKHCVFVDAEGGYQCWPDHPGRVRKPDISFVLKERLPGGKPYQGWCRVSPDFAIEIMSKNDSLAEHEEKVAEYLEVGVSVVWIVNPIEREVYIYEGNLNSVVKNGTDVIEHPDLMPGFRCTAEELFPS